MRSRPECFKLPFVAGAVALSIASGWAMAQTAGGAQPISKPAPCSAADQSAGKCATAAGPSQQFPYPGDHAAADPEDPVSAGAPSPSSSPATPVTPSGSNSPDAPTASGAKQFPYPGDPDPAAVPGGSGSSSSTSSSSSADPDDPLDTPATAANITPGRRKLPKVKKLQSDEDREAEDVKVAKFYHDDGNTLAAYNRLRDATKLVADDADAWYLLGDVAQQLHKPEEASEAYRKFLALEPNTRRAKTLAREQPQLNAKK